MYTPNTLIYYHSFSWLGTGTSIKSNWVKIVLWAQTTPLNETRQSYKCFLQARKMPTLAYSKATSVIIKNAIILNSMQNIFNLRDTEVVICIILVLFKESCRGRHHMVVGFITICAINVYHHCCEFEIPLIPINIMWWKLVIDLRQTDQWFSPGTLVSSTNKTDSHLKFCWKWH
jgi:hypothetical protein